MTLMAKLKATGTMLSIFTFAALMTASHSISSIWPVGRGHSFRSFQHVLKYFSVVITVLTVMVRSGSTQYSIAGRTVRHNSQRPIVWSGRRRLFLQAVRVKGPELRCQSECGRETKKLSILTFHLLFCNF